MIPRQVKGKFGMKFAVTWKKQDFVFVELTKSRHVKTSGKTYARIIEIIYPNFSKQEAVQMIPKRSQSSLIPSKQ